MKRLHTNAMHVNTFSSITQKDLSKSVRDKGVVMFITMDRQLSFLTSITERKYGVWGISSFYKDELPEIR